MTPLCRQSLIEQTARHLRDMIDAGHWGREMPGALVLARSCSVSRDTALAALQLLEKEGTLYPGGSGKNRVIRRRRRPGRRARALRVAVLLDEPLPTNNAHSQELILSIKNAIEAEGHVCDLCDKAMNQMGTLRQLARFARSMAADAWIVYSGSREVLIWFAQKQVPVLAIGGRALGLPIASTYTDISRAMAAAVDAFVEKGHRRIVLICPGFWRSPIPGPSTQAFLERLRHHGIKVSDFNLPAWKETPEGFETMLNSLFRITPPTALVAIEPAYCVAARILLAERGVLVPRDLSLVSILPDPAFSLLRQPIAHFDWTISALVGRATDWIKAVARGVTDHEVRFFHAKFQPGGTIAAARRERPSS